ncbi:MAG: copper amine oxidase N-terminal domain-containing protein [Armatimonadetes bacterium]|nr:copper amine oxidase N-terminal domain-containing protein [Armatimonadota bacterium]
MKKVFLCILMCASAGMTAAQGIGVTVDGRTVSFQGAGPMMMSGRVMVPLRGVLEAMGAYVEYRAATRTIIARRGNTDLELGLGDRSALVNGRTVMLDVPAATVMGSTMVPLRFMGESLGADVRWIESTKSVVISTTGGGDPGGGGNPPGGGGGGGNPPGGGGGALEIQSFSHDSTGWLRPGDVLQVSMVGTPNGQASFRIPGIVDNVAMREVNDGRYAGSWTVPPAGTAVNLAGASVLGVLRIGRDERLIQAANRLSVDTEAPRIATILPEANARVVRGQVSVSAVFDDGSGSGIDPATVRMIVNGRDVTDQATITPSFANLRPDQIIIGRNVATVSAEDRAGNRVSKSWAFTVADATSEIKLLTHDAPTRVEPGDVITVRLEGAKGGRATFDVGRNQNMPMSENPDGVYVGRYTVRRGEDLSNAPVIATLEVGNNKYTVEAKDRINASASTSELDAPKVTSPADGAKVNSPMVVRGTAAPNTKIRVKVEYTTSLLGAIAMSGTIGDQALTTDAQGNFRSAPFELDTPLGGQDTKFTITVIAISDAGKESPKKVVKVEKA